MKNLILTTAILLMAAMAYGQGIAINEDGATPDPSAMLDVTSTEKGILIPRMTQAQRDAIAEPATGLLVFQTDATPGFYYNAGNTVSPNWQQLGDEISLPAGSSMQTLRHDGSSWVANSVFRNNGTGLGVYANPIANTQLYVHRPEDFLYGPGYSNVYAVRGFMDAESGGSSWSLSGIDAAIKGHSEYGNHYSAGVAGYSFLNYENSAAIIGSIQNGSTFGALAFKDAGNNLWAGYFNGSVSITGNVGIGTASPQSKQHIRGGGDATTPLMTIENMFDDATSLSIKNEFRTWLIGMNRRALLPEDAFYIFDQTADAARMVIKSNGNLGIGINDPLAQLHTSGSVRFAGAGTPGTGKVLTSDINGTATWQNLPAGSSLFTAGNGLTWSSNTLNSVWTQSGNNIHKNNPGNVGIGTTSPVALLHVLGTGTSGGNVLFAGSFKSTPGEPPTGAAGTRMMWYPDKAAFRAGRVNGTQWSMSNIGNYSVAMGYNTIADGEYSFATGNGAEASGNYSAAMGFNTKAEAFGAFASGHQSTASQNYATAIGTTTNASGIASIALGSNTTASGTSSIAMGYSSTASGFYSTAIGRNANASQDYSFAINLNTEVGPNVIAHRFQISGASAIGGNHGWSNWSDSRLKKDIQSIANESNIDKIMQLNGVRFRWKECNPDIADRYYLGFLAQEVMAVIPEPVVYDELNDIYSMKYSAIITVLVEAVKEQQLMIQRLQQEMETLKNR